MLRNSVLVAGLCVCVHDSYSREVKSSVRDLKEIDIRPYEDGERLIYLYNLVSSKKHFQEFIDTQFNVASAQYQLLASNLKEPVADVGPRAFENGEVSPNRNPNWWTSGFFPGSLWLIFEHNREEQIKALAEESMKFVEPSQYYSGMTGRAHM
jgi:hypothetical protein